MSEKDYLKDISEIKQIMNRSTRFMSLSGLSGVLAGMYALAGGLLAYYLLKGKGYEYGYDEIIERLQLKLILIAFVVASISAITGYILTKRRADKNNEKMWTPVSKLMLESFCIPLGVGGVLVLMMIYKGYYGLIAPLTLIFYGLALFNASRYTFSDVKYLGLLEIVLGLIAFWNMGQGLLFWLIGFGVLHIIYGGLMYFRRERTVS